MQSLLRLSKGIDGFNEKVSWIADWMVLLSCSVSALNAAVRYAFNYSSNSYLEIQWYMFGAMVFLGASYTLKMNEHVRVDIIYSSISDRARLWIDLFGFIVFMLPITVFLAWMSWPLFWMAFKSGEMSSNAGGLMTWPAKALIPLGFALLTVQGVSELIKRIAALRGEYELEAKYEKPLQ